jgi:small subunit ribosomal protein S6
MPLYEMGLILVPELEGEERDEYLGELRELLTGSGAEILKEDVWGKRTLAYSINHKREGFYVFWQFEGPGSAVKPLEFKLKLSDQVLRYLTLNLDNEMRRSRKFEVLRQKKAKAKPRKDTAPVGGGEGAEAPAAEV